MAKVIILSVLVTIAVLLFLIWVAMIIFKAGEESARKELNDKITAAEDLSREYQERLAQVRAERNLMKRGDTK